MSKNLDYQQRACSIAALLSLVASLCMTGPAVAQTFPSPKEHEEAQIRRELERIIAEVPQEAPNARKALEALNQPVSTAEGRQARNRRERRARRIVNGLPAGGHSAVGALLKGSNWRTASAWCTGTLVGCDKFLTAAHCIEGDTTPETYLVFFQELGFFVVSKITWPKNDYKFPYFDLAMLTLGRDVDGVAPVAINTSVKPLNKSIATIVGFGRTGGAREDYGIKREGSAQTEGCSPTHANHKVLCWKFDADVKSGLSRSNTCNGDSGGGVFMLDWEGQRLVQKIFGVVSGGGRDKHCVKEDESYNVDVFQFRQWIENAGEGRLSSRICGRLIGEAEPKRKLLQLGDNNREETIRMEVPSGVTVLRIAMNGEDDGKGKNDFDLLVHSGAQLEGSKPVCDDNGPGQFAFCEIKRPEPGVWTILVRRKKGSGDVQITATLFMNDPLR